MIAANKTYGFTIAVKELKETVPNIWRYASAYKRVNNITSKGLWEMFVEPQENKPESKPEDDPNYRPPIPEAILESGGSLPDIDPEAMEGEKYNMCHFWSNFEIARLDWFRSKEYEDFFQMMDKSGGFWMERVRLSLIFRGPSWRMLTCDISGVTRQSILLPPVLFCHQKTSTTSVTSVTDTRPFSIVQLMRHQVASCHVSHGWNRQPSMRRLAKRRMSTGKAGMSQRRTALAADADAIPIS